jgi:transcription elongation GreA/GreB family factor
MTTKQHTATTATTVSDTGRARLQEELDLLCDEREPQSWQRVRDLRDGAPAEIEHLLTQEPSASVDADGAITLGSRVIVCDSVGREHQFILVSPLEAGTTRGFISTASPVGVALLGRRTGDEIQVETPAGRRVFTVMSVT